MRMSLDLYPPVQEPSGLPSWEDVERLAKYYPEARNAVVMVLRGDWTREQAMAWLVLTYASMFSKMFHQEVDRRSRTFDPILVMPEASY